MPHRAYSVSRPGSGSAWHAEWSRSAGVLPGPFSHSVTVTAVGTGSTFATDTGRPCITGVGAVRLRSVAHREHRGSGIPKSRGVPFEAMIRVGLNVADLVGGHVYVQLRDDNAVFFDDHPHVREVIVFGVSLDLVDDRRCHGFTVVDMSGHCPVQGAGVLVTGASVPGVGSDVGTAVGIVGVLGSSDVGIAVGVGADAVGATDRRADGGGTVVDAAGPTCRVLRTRLVGSVCMGVTGRRGGGAAVGRAAGVEMIAEGIGWMCST